MEIYTEKLEQFKATEKPEVVLLIADQNDLVKIIVAWTNTTITRADQLTPLPSDSDNALWKWLWENTVFSLEEVILKSALWSYGFKDKIRPLIANRVLYPDGTINSYVQRYLRDRVLKLFESKPKRSEKKSNNIS